MTTDPVGPTFAGIPRMPAIFGRQPGPRRRADGPGRHPADAGSTLNTFVVARADANALVALLPRHFVLAGPLLIVEAISVDGLPWLAGRGYEVLVVSTPVIYLSAAGDEHRGRLALVVWEDCPDAIISGREELGWSKVYADAMVRSVDGDHVTYTVAWHGTEFFRMDVQLDGSPPGAGAWRAGPLMHYRVLPRTGDWGRLEVEQVTGQAQVSEPDPGAVRGGIGSFQFVPSTFARLPTLVHIVNGLAGISLGDPVEAGQFRSRGWSDLYDMRVLGDHLSDARRDHPACGCRFHSPTNECENHD
jgi:Acetoacetate decarboxylase (ADC)